MNKQNPMQYSEWIEACKEKIRKCRKSATTEEHHKAVNQLNQNFHHLMSMDSRSIKTDLILVIVGCVLVAATLVVTSIIIW